MSMRIARLSYSCRASKRRAIEERKQVWQQELIEAMRTKEFAVGWRLARLLAGTGCGPKKRRYAAAMKARPSKEEWERALKAQWGLRAVKKSLKRMAFRKACADWCAPVEIWRGLLLEAPAGSKESMGVGFLPQLKAPRMEEAILHVLMRIRAMQLAPWRGIRRWATSWTREETSRAPTPSGSFLAFLPSARLTTRAFLGGHREPKASGARFPTIPTAVGQGCRGRPP
mmetsp:Transcript_69845/g.197913  ORF Transcript_69845/g.197913 Transcript_69845/m.197913 type:complete len:228 (-) Transcript_69845:1465-2148(-)